MKALLVYVALGSSLALAQTNLCTNALAVDNQPTFDTSNIPDRTAVSISNGKLKLETALVPFDPEKIVLPVDQRLTISYVYESAGATHTTGYLYYDDLIAAGYIDTKNTADSSDDTLIDSNGNGIADFHEDLYNLAPNNSTDAKYRPYVGRSSDRRCTTTFTSGGFTYTVPELAASNCTSGLLTSQSLRDASRPANWANGPNITTDVVGTSGSYSTTAYNDKGLFPSVPNLIEPAAVENGNRGLGRIIFALNDDDNDTSVWNGFPTIADATALVDGIPDYDVSKYDATGRLMATNPDPGITTADRTVDLGVVPGGKELVMFMVAYYSSGHGGTTVFPCLRFNGAGQCTLHLNSPIGVYFSKARLNLDQNPQSADPAAIRNIGCGYPGSGLATGPSTSSYKNTTQGCWLDSATVTRLGTSAYNRLVLPAEATFVPRPTNGQMPHVIVGAPSTDPYRWIFGFEDLPGGGDRDFNDVVLIINKTNGGTARAATVSSSIPVVDASSMTVTKVRFRRTDDVSRGTWTGNCSGTPAPSIRYYFALDCRNCSSGTCLVNPQPAWSEVVFPPGVNEQTVDTLSLGLVGSQLCWKADITSPRDTCTPVIDDVDVGYQAVRAGDYSRSSVIPIANTAQFSAYETPGATWNGTTTADPTASARTYDAKKDLSLRGHLYDKRLYDPDSTTPTTTAASLLWDAAEKLSMSMPGRASDALNRKLYTLSSASARVEVKDELADPTTPALPTTAYNTQSLGKYPYDLNRSSAGNAPADDSDRAFLRDWLYGWEDRQGAAAQACQNSGTCRLQGSTNSPIARAWPMAGVQFSSPAIIAAPATASWYNLTTANERASFVSNFSEPLKNRQTVSFVGTLGGYLHAFDAGAYRRGEDPCTGTSYRGYFLKSPCTGARNYGSGAELFAYLPRGLLSKYVRNYIGDLPGQSTAPAQINAPPSFADVDLGNLGTASPWTIDSQSRPAFGAKTALISATGPLSDLVFALDVTDPSKAANTVTTGQRWPVPMWEWRMGSVLPLTTALKQPDTRGSRHSPPIIRADFGSTWGTRWIVAIATDFVPNSGTAGTVYLLDVATGAPVQLGSATVGVVTLELNEGIGGEPTAADINGDGNYDVLYVPSTSGKVFRINFAQVNPQASAPDQRVPSCVVADTAATLVAGGVTANEASLQGIYSSLALRINRQTSPVVQIYFGTADNPDDPNDAQASRYYVMAYEDDTPMGACQALPLWQQTLNTGQQVWGGVTLGQSNVFAVTAVGTAADACNLSPTEAGRLYTLPQQTTLTSLSPVAAPTSAPQVPPSVSGGQVFDEQFIFTTADGQLKAAGSGIWNNAPGAGTASRRRTLMWEALPPGRLP